MQGQLDGRGHALYTGGKAAAARPLIDASDVRCV